MPQPRSIEDLRVAAQACRACELWAGATQAVVGEGAAPAEAMLVGEQPGDREDVEGAPFVGPAGRMLDRGLEDAGIDVGRIYVTNVVKHFRWRARGKRRIHQKPDAVHIAACRPWLDAELALVRPRVLVCLGATAAQALVGRGVRVTVDRGRPLDSPLAEHVLATVLPPRCCARRTRRRGGPRTTRSWRICGSWRGCSTARSSARSARRRRRPAAQPVGWGGG